MPRRFFSDDILTDEENDNENDNFLIGDDEDDDGDDDDDRNYDNYEEERNINTDNFTTAKEFYEPVRPTIQVNSSLVSTNDFEISSGQKITLLVPRKTSSNVSVNFDKTKLTTASGFLDGVGQNITSLAIDAASKVFAKLFIDGMKNGVLSQDQALKMARQSDKSLHELENNLYSCVNKLTRSGSKSMQAEMLHGKIQKYNLSLKQQASRLSKIDPVVANMGSKYKDIQSMNDKYVNNSRTLKKLEQRYNKTLSDTDKNSERLLQAIYQMQKESKELLLVFIESIKNAHQTPYRRDSSIDNLVKNFDTLIEKKVLEMLEVANVR